MTFPHSCVANYRYTCFNLIPTTVSDGSQNQKRARLECMLLINRPVAVIAYCLETGIVSSCVKLLDTAVV
jgi:hypothetical protein